MAVERMGVNPAWLKGAKKHYANFVSWQKINSPIWKQELEYYVLHGKPIDYEKTFIDRSVTPQIQIWEFGLDGGLGLYGLEALHKLEFNKSIEEKEFDKHLAVRAFAANYTMEMINLYRHILFPLRHDGRVLNRMTSTNVQHTAFGAVIGCTHEAFSLAKLQVAGLQRGYYEFGGAPTSNFILRLILEFLGEHTAFIQAGGLPTVPVLHGLATYWRAPNPQTVEPWLLAACDFHTHNCSGKDRNRGEFANAKFARIPIEILLVLKLRQLLGLENPILDHPLMQSSFGLPPSDVDFSDLDEGEDTLLGRVRARMKQDGYDEGFIFKEGTK